MISLAFNNEVVLTDDRASSLRRLMSPLSQNKAIVYFGYPEGIGQLVPPLSFSPKQTDKSWFVAFGNEIAQTDDRAFGDEIAQTDDNVIVEATRTSAFLLPKANRQSLGLSRSVTRLRRQMTLSSLKQLVPPLSQNKQLIIVYFGYPMRCCCL